MSNKVYIFDTNCFIEPWNKFYSHSSFGDYWDTFILNSLKDSEILMMDQVYLELERKKDSLLDWIKKSGVKNFDSYITTDKNMSDTIQDTVLGKYPELIAGKESGSADPTIIAAAIEFAKQEPGKTFTVVTLEGHGGRKHPKIPFVCKELGVACINLYEYISIKKPQFILR